MLLHRVRNLAVDLRRAVRVWSISIQYGAAPVARRLLHRPSNTADEAYRLRQALETLGLTYLKLGQFLALRYDLLPAEFCRELNKLFEQVAPFPFDSVRAIVEPSLSAPLETLFAEFDPVPIASASIAQVHRARTHDGHKVAVKVRRPGIRAVFDSDIRNLRRAALLGDAVGLLGSLSLTDVVDEFAGWTRRELDLTIEGRTADRLRSNALPYEVVPQIHWNLTREEILTMEFIEGTTLVQVMDLLERGRVDLILKQLPNLDITLAGDRIAHAVLNQLFVNGFFHADPHPGNLILRDDNTVAFIDFGIYGELSRRQRDILQGHIEQIAVGNIEESFRYYAMQYIPTEDTDQQQFEREGKRILRNWYEAATNPYAVAKDRHLATHGAEMLEAVRRNRLRLNMNTLLFWRTLYTLDSLALRLSDYIDLMSQMKRFFSQTRPGLAERVSLLVTDHDRLGVSATHIRTTLDRMDPHVRTDERARHALTRVVAASSLRRSRAVHARGTAIALMGVSVSLLFTATTPTIPSGMIAVSLSLFLLVLVTARKGS